MGMWNPLSRGPLFALLTAIQVEFPASFNCSIINVGKIVQIWAALIET